MPPKFNAEKINSGIALGGSKIEERGWRGDTCMITPDPAGSVKLDCALKGVAYDCALKGVAYDCVVIGGGLRLPPKGLPLGKHESPGDRPNHLTVTDLKSAKSSD